MGIAENLINDTVRSLQNKHGWGKGAFSAPSFPVCVMYFGEQSAAMHLNVLQTLSAGWGANANHLLYIQLPHADSLQQKQSNATEAAVQNESGALVDIRSGQSMDIGRLQHQMMDMLGKTTVFRSTSQCMLFCVLDTRGLDAQSFAHWYSVIKDIRDIFQGITINAMLMLMLDYSVGTSNAEIIADTVAKLYQDEKVSGANRHLYESVFVLGNRRADGSFTDLFNGSESERSIYPQVMLLADTRDGSSEDGSIKWRKSLYGVEYPAFTAACTFVSKPNRSIAVVALQTVLNLLVDHINHTPQATVNNVQHVLRVKDGHTELLNQADAIINEICAQYNIGGDGQGFVRFLPRRSGAVDVAFDTLPYAEVDQQSYGCLDAFIRLNHMIKLHDKLHTADMGVSASDIATAFVNELTAAQVTATSQDVLGSLTENVLDGLTQGEAAWHNASVQSAIAYRMRDEMLQGIRQTVSDYLPTMIDTAEATMRAFRELNEEVNAYAAVGSIDASIQRFYGSKIRTYFSGGSVLADACKQVLRIGNDKSAIAEALFEILQHLFSSDSVFQLDFMSELVAREGAGKPDGWVEKFVGNKLTGGINANSVGFYTLWPMEERIVESYLLYRDTNPGTPSGKLNTFLVNHPNLVNAVRTFFNQQDADSATTMWFYPLTVNHL